MTVQDPAHREDRDRLLASIVSSLKGDPRVVAAWLAGSLGRDGGDDLSDIDLSIVVDDGAMATIAADPGAYVRSVTPTALEFPAPANAPAGGAYLLTLILGQFGPHQVDWYWMPAGTALRPPGTRLLFARRPIPERPAMAPLAQGALDQAIDAAAREALTMALITVKRIARGNPWVISTHLRHVARCVATVEWLAMQATPPTYDDLREPALPAVIPDTPRGQFALLRSLLGRLGAAMAPPSETGDLAGALDAIAAWLDRIDHIT